MKLYKTLESALKNPTDVSVLKLLWEKKHYPTELSNFPKLTELIFEAPQFAGDLSELFKIKTLTNLKIVNTPIERLILPIGVTPTLRFLTLKNCSLKELPTEFSSLGDLEECSLTENKLNELPSTFYLLAKLRRLNLDANLFKKFPEIVLKAPSLRHLSIDHNLFSDEEKSRIQRLFHLTVN
jgi:Leucine-rich repeat (LRR) protein